jgi:hypothetical protein
MSGVRASQHPPAAPQRLEVAPLFGFGWPQDHLLQEPCSKRSRKWRRTRIPARFPAPQAVHAGRTDRQLHGAVRRRRPRHRLALGLLERGARCAQRGRDQLAPVQDQVRRLTDLVDCLEKQRIIQRENTAELRGTIATAINRRADNAVEPPHGLRQSATPTTRPWPRALPRRRPVRLRSSPGWRDNQLIRASARREACAHAPSMRCRAGTRPLAT